VFRKYISKSTTKSRRDKDGYITEKKVFISDGQQFQQYQQNKRKF
jgi:16S rRNA U516 pseudouridylate synthase RsuA-like enzyme